MGQPTLVPQGHGGALLSGGKPGNKGGGNPPKHGMVRRGHTEDADHNLYRRWESMKNRCSNPRTKSYKYYGGRGIGVCEEWRNDPVAFATWARANGYDRHLQVDRIDSDGDYGPSNCRFVSQQENLRNRRPRASKNSG